MSEFQQLFCIINRYMKILFINGENKENGLIQQAFSYMQSRCDENGIAYDTIMVDEHHDHPCTACGKCIKRRACIFEGVNETLNKADEYTGVIVGGTVLYDSLNRETVSFMDRLMRAGNERFSYKVGASLISARKGKKEEAYTQLNHYMDLADMVVVGNQNCGTLTGNEEDEMIITTVIDNIIWLMKAIELANDNKIKHSINPVLKITDFMR